MKISTALDLLRKDEREKNFWLVKIMQFMLWKIFKKKGQGAVVPDSKVLNSFG